jgi:hypothetical protein
MRDGHVHDRFENKEKTKMIRQYFQGACSLYFHLSYQSNNAAKIAEKLMLIINLLRASI